MADEKTVHIKLKPRVTVEHRNEEVSINGTTHRASSEHSTELPQSVADHFTDYEEVAPLPEPKRTKDKPKKAQKRK